MLGFKAVQGNVHGELGGEAEGHRGLYLGGV